MSDQVPLFTKHLPVYFKRVTSIVLNSLIDFRVMVQLLSLRRPADDKFEETFWQLLLVTLRRLMT